MNRNDGSRGAAAGDDQFHGQLIRLDEDAMLLPNSAVLDVVSVDDLRVRTSPPSWLLGHIPWRQQEVPVVSMEGLLGREVPARMRRSRVVIINSYGSQLHAGMFAVVSQGHPHLMTLNRVAIKAATSPPDAADNEHVACRVTIANAQAFIPDLEVIESSLSSVVVDSASEFETPWEPSF